MLSISQNGGSIWLGQQDSSNSSPIGNGEAAFKRGENIGGAVPYLKSLD